MTTFIMMTLAYVLGTLISTGLVLAIILNKKVMRAYMKWAAKMSIEITNELVNNYEKEEEA